MSSSLVFFSEANLYQFLNEQYVCGIMTTILFPVINALYYDQKRVQNASLLSTPKIQWFDLGGPSFLLLGLNNPPWV